MVAGFIKVLAAVDETAFKIDIGAEGPGHKEVIKAGISVCAVPKMGPVFSVNVLDQKIFHARGAVPRS